MGLESEFLVYAKGRSIGWSGRVARGVERER